jgi:hypothetical protein
MFEIEDLTATDRIIRNERGNDEKVLFSNFLVGNWSFFADGYKLAADVLVDQVEGNPPEDCLIAPILFLYRHWVELKLKELILSLKVLSVAEITRPNHHHLYDLWSIVKSNLHCLRDSSNQDFILLDARIKELNGLDPDGYRFRYPVNTQSEITELPESLGIKNLKDTMDKVSNAFGLIDGGIDGEMEGRALDAELEAEMRSYSSWE